MVAEQPSCVNRPNGQVRAAPSGPERAEGRDAFVPSWPVSAIAKAGTVVCRLAAGLVGLRFLRRCGGRHLARQEGTFGYFPGDQRLPEQLTEVIPHCLET